MRPTLNNNRDDLPSLSIRRPVLVLVVNLLIVLAGLAAEGVHTRRVLPAGAQGGVGRREELEPR